MSPQTPHLPTRPSILEARSHMWEITVSTLYSVVALGAASGGGCRGCGCCSGGVVVIRVDRFLSNLNKQQCFSRQIMPNNFANRLVLVTGFCVQY